MQTALQINYRHQISKIIARSSFYETRKKFFCPEESHHYSEALEHLVFRPLEQQEKKPLVVEFGSGTGEPVISALLNSNYNGMIDGYEINPEAARSATTSIIEHGLHLRYQVHNKSFFDEAPTSEAGFLIANPPYIPSLNRDALILPDLCGGPDGTDISKKLLTFNCPNVFLLVSSYSDPKGLILHALQHGYVVADFRVTTMSFGIYSQQNMVQKRIHDMKTEGKAFFSKDYYLVGSVVFSKQSSTSKNMSHELLSCLTSL